MRKLYKKLTYEDRKKIQQMTANGHNPREMAVATDVSLQTMYRELQRGKDGSGCYNAEIAQRSLFTQ